MLVSAQLLGYGERVDTACVELTIALGSDPIGVISSIAHAKNKSESTLCPGAACSLHRLGSFLCTMSSFALHTSTSALLHSSHHPGSTCRGASNTIKWWRRRSSMAGHSLSSHFPSPLLISPSFEIVASSPSFPGYEPAPQPVCNGGTSLLVPSVTLHVYPVGLWARPLALAGTSVLNASPLLSVLLRYSLRQIGAMSIF